MICGYQLINLGANVVNLHLWTVLQRWIFTIHDQWTSITFICCYNNFNNLSCRLHLNTKTCLLSKFSSPESLFNQLLLWNKIKAGDNKDIAKMQPFWSIVVSVFETCIFIFSLFFHSKNVRKVVYQICSDLTEIEKKRACPLDASICHSVYEILHIVFFFFSLFFCFLSPGQISTWWGTLQWRWPHSTVTLISLYIVVFFTCFLSTALFEFTKKKKKIAGKVSEKLLLFFFL